jgi:methyltransferase family protein
LKLSIEIQICPLCKASDVSMMYRDTQRDYFRCHICSIVFVPHKQFLTAREEKVRYDLHQNSSNDQRYRHFLNRLFIPLQERLSPESHGLDFGSGPGPTLSVMFEEAGYSMAIFDKYYESNPSVLTKKYDFITATEVLEHLQKPKEELDMLWACLKPGGWLGMMTKLALGREAFSRWHYKNDPTHICFFSAFTFEWLASQWQAELTFAGKDVILFHKKN